MTLIVAGAVRVPPQNMAALRPHLAKVIAATQQEPGNIAYTWGEDPHDPGLLRLFEIWRDQAALDAHFATPHMAERRAENGKLGLGERNLTVYEIASERRM